MFKNKTMLTYKNESKLNKSQFKLLIKIKKKARKNLAFKICIIVFYSTVTDLAKFLG